MTVHDEGEHPPKSCPDLRLHTGSGRTAEYGETASENRCQVSRRGPQAAAGSCDGGLLRTRLTSAVVSSRIAFTIPRRTDAGGRSIKMALSGERREIGLRRTGFPVEWPFRGAFSGENVRLQIVAPALRPG